MKKYLLLFFFFSIVAPLFSQGDSMSMRGVAAISRENVNVTIFPVPVRDNSFTVNADKEISYIKVTNIIGQDIFKSRFNEQKSIKIFLNNVKRGMYIITISFSDDTRVVRKIMIEESD